MRGVAYSSPQMADRVDERYEILNEVGRGGTANVYRARDRVLDRLVALKVLSGPIANDPDFMARFEREARLAARLDHPNVVTIYDFGRLADGRGFIAMKLLEGTSLDRLLGTPALTPALTVTIVHEVAAALDFLHGRGMVHRDIKPSNLIIDAAGHATLTDFGIARAFDSARVTLTGLTVGTPRYMAPEQIRGEDVTQAADLYALGVMTFEMLAGRPPFQGEGTALMFKIVHEPPPPITSVNANLPAAVAGVLARSLEKTPEARWSSAGEFARALESALEQMADSPAPVPDVAPTIMQPAAARPPSEVRRVVIPDAPPPPPAPVAARVPVEPPPAPVAPAPVARRPSPPSEPVAEGQWRNQTSGFHPLAPKPRTEPPPAPPEPPRRSRKWLVFVIVAVVAVLAVVAAFLLFAGGGNDYPQGASAEEETPAETGQPSASPVASTPSAAAAAAPPSAAAATATPTLLPTVTAPGGTPSQLRSGAAGIVVAAGCTLRLLSEPSEAAAATPVRNLCNGERIVVATNSPATSTVRVTEGLVFWRVLVEGTSEVGWVKEVEVSSGTRFIRATQ